MDEFGTPFDAFLDPGERLLWSGQPKQGVRFETADFYQIPSSLLICCFVIVWELIALQIPISAKKGTHHSGAEHVFSWIFPLWGLPFLVMGLHTLIGRFFYDAGVRKRTWYGLSDHRLIIIKSHFNTSVSSFDRATLTNLNLVERTDGTGDILFGTQYPAMPFQRMSWPGMRRRLVPGFYDLSGARKVYNQIRAVQSEAKK